MDPNAIASALANTVAEGTGLRTSAQVKDTVNVPIAFVLPGNPFITYADTMDGAVKMSWAVVLLLSDAPPTDKVQRALNAYLGIGPGEGNSIPEALAANPTLGGVVEWCVPLAITSFNRVEWNSVIFFGGRLNVSVGAI